MVNKKLAMKTSNKKNIKEALNKKSSVRQEGTAKG